jgi:hypothetical protein
MNTAEATNRSDATGALFRAAVWFMGLVSIAFSGWLAAHFLGGWTRSYIGWCFLGVGQAGVLVCLINLKIDELSKNARDTIVKLFLVIGFLTFAFAWLLKG